MELEPVLKEVIAGTFDPKKAEADKAALEQSGKDLEKAMAAGDFEAALKIIDGVEKQRPDMAGQVQGLRFSILLQKKDYDNAYKAAAKFGEAMNDNAAALNEVAWTIVDAPGLEKRDLDLAEKLATRSVELTERKESQALDTLARIQFEKGQVDKAVATETEALDKADADTKPQIQGSLEKYTKAKSGGATTQPG
jgi:tetratricopeptide (TPR) repeat protein